MLKKFWDFIAKSIESKIGGKISATRISSYLILGSILTTTAVYLAIDIVNAFHKWSCDEYYVIPTEHIIFFGMILTHHLALLGINKAAETKQANGLPKIDGVPEKIDKKKDISTSEDEMDSSSTSV